VRPQLACALLRRSSLMALGGVVANFNLRLTVRLTVGTPDPHASVHQEAVWGEAPR
jgi:hypothetical protein